MKLPSLSPQTVFYVAGALTTAASIKGTGAYLMTETNGDLLLSTAGAVALGIAVYAGCEVAFNHKGAVKRVVAGFVAAAAIALSSYTIYQHITLPLLEQQQAELRQQQTDAQAEAQRVRQQQAAVTQTLQQQQADLRQQIEDLRQFNATDASHVTDLDGSSQKGAAWQAVQLRKAIAERNTEISHLMKRLENYTQRLTATPVTPVAETVQQNTSSNTAGVPLDRAILARASLYDLMTLLLVLFAGWFKTHKREKDRTELLSLKAAKTEVNLLLEQAQKAHVSLHGLIAHAHDVIDDVATGGNTIVQRAINGNESIAQGAITPIAQYAINADFVMTYEMALKQLKRQQFQPTNDGYITVQNMMRMTGLGRRKCEQLQAEAFAEGFLTRKRKGRNHVYLYPEQAQNSYDNVIQLAHRTA
jgi:hypothetical protein